MKNSRTTAKSVAQIAFQQLRDHYKNHASMSAAFAEVLSLLLQDAKVYALPINGFVAKHTTPQALYQQDDWLSLPEPVVTLHYNITGETFHEPVSQRIILCFDLQAANIPANLQQAMVQTHQDLQRYSGVGIVTIAQAVESDIDSTTVLPMAGIVAKKAFSSPPQIHMVGLFQERLQENMDQFGQDYLYEVSTNLQLGLLNLSHWLIDARGLRL